MTPDISQLLIFNPDLTIGGYFKLYPDELKRIIPAPKEYDTIEMSSTINELHGTGEYVRAKPKYKAMEWVKVINTNNKNKYKL